MPEYKIKVNGDERTVEAPAEMPVLWVLRDLLDLTGSKYGCGAGVCGSCTVLVDGNPVRSCVYPVSALGDASVTTIEGLSHENFHPLQQAWMEHDVPQCGYCQSGQILAAAALLEQNPSPTDEEIDRAMDLLICRCGTYTRIRSAIKSVAKETK